VNVYRIHLDGYERLWATTSMNGAIDLAFNQWLEDHPGEPREYFEGVVLRGAGFIGELENDITEFSELREDLSKAKFEAENLRLANKEARKTIDRLHELVD